MQTLSSSDHPWSFYVTIFPPPSVTAAPAPPSYMSSTSSSTYPGPPPSYDEVAEAEPPSYNSLFGEVKEIEEAPRNILDVVKLTANFLLKGVLGCLPLVLPICMILVGSIYLGDCPAEPHLPLFLIVVGFIIILKYLLWQIFKIKKLESWNKVRSLLQVLTTLLLFAWFVAGIMWIYRKYNVQGSRP